MTRKRKISNDSILEQAYPKLKELFYHFSKETSFHGFKRLWVGSWMRWPFWMMIIFGGVVMSIYQIKNKLDVLIENPMSINMNMVYQDQLEFPAVTVCNKVKVRVSFVVNNSILLNLLHIIDPSGSTINYVNDENLVESETVNQLWNRDDSLVQSIQNLTDQTARELKKVDQLWKTKDFFAQAGIAKDEFIVWCLLPNGESCSSDDFKTTITDEGYCYTLDRRIYIRETGRGSLKVLFNLADYERIPTQETETVGGTWLVIHEHDENPMPSKGYDLMPGYQVKISLRKTVDRQLGNCEASNPLTYFSKYTYPACRVEQKLTHAATRCKCKPFMLPKAVNTNGKFAYIEQYPDCPLSVHFTCIQKTFEDFSFINKTASNSCTGECLREDFEQHAYPSYLKESLYFKPMLGSKIQLLQDAYQQGKDSAAFLRFFQQMDQNYNSVLEASKGFESLIVQKRLVPPYGTIANVLLEQLQCLDDLLHTYGKNVTLGKSSKKKKKIDKSLYGVLTKNIKNLDSKLDTLDIDEIFNFSYSLTKIHLNKCTAESKEICSLAALYDFLKIRTQLVNQKMQVQSLNDLLKNFTRSVDQYFGKSQFKFPTDNETEFDDDKRLKHILQYYVRQVTICLKDTNRIYDKILNSGQPNMKSSNSYYGFLNDLHSINLTIHATCKKGGSHVEALFNVSDRRHLALKTIELMATSETELSKISRFGNMMTEMVGKMQNKLWSLDYNKQLLNQSLYDIQTIDKVLEKYLSQTTEEVFRKSQFYKALYSMKQPFQRGLNHYKNIVTKHLLEMEVFFQSYIDKLIELYPGPESDIATLTLATNLDELNISSISDVATFEHIVCLKKAKAVLSVVGSVDGDTTYLESYKQTVDSLFYSLKQYADEIGSLQKIFRDNLAFVKISFQDMGIRESKQERVYDVLSFLCDIGGIVGLWLGGSIVSLIEIFDLLFFEHVETICKPKKNGKYDYEEAKTRNSPVHESSGTEVKQKPSESCLESLL